MDISIAEEGKMLCHIINCDVDKAILFWSFLFIPNRYRIRWDYSNFLLYITYRNFIKSKK